VIQGFLSQYVGRDIKNKDSAKKFISDGVNDIVGSVAQLQTLGIPFTPNREQANVLSREIGKKQYREATPDQRRAILNRIIFGGR
jgi:hypothetical protein